jgi:hypothetical protein
VSGSGWGHVSVVAPAGSLGSAPATNFDPENHSQNVYFQGTDGSLREISWTPSGGWDQVSVVAPAGSLGSAPATNFDPENHSQNVYFAGPDGSLREIAWTPSSGWGRVSVVAPTGSLGSAPATNFDPDNHSQNVYFAGPDGSLREISWTPSAHWDAMSVITSTGTLSAPAGGSSPAPPAGTGTVALTPTRPKRHRRLSVKIVISWRWNHRQTRLVRIKLGRMPARAAFSISCRGRGCPAHKLHASSATIHRRHRTLRGKVYRAGDRLLLSLTAPSWSPERARITIRDGRPPAVHLL